jgi:hypothetical protein
LRVYLLPEQPGPAGEFGRVSSSLAKPELLFQPE